jgi:transposase-like protein
MRRPNRTYTRQQIGEIIESYVGGKSIAQIARDADISDTRISGWIERHWLGPRRDGEIMVKQDKPGDGGAEQEGK